DRRKRRSAELLEDAEQLALNQLDARGHRRRRWLSLGRLQRPIEVVEDGEQFSDQRFVGEADVVLALAGRALARIVELGHQADISVLQSLDLSGLGVERVLQS